MSVLSLLLFLFLVVGLSPMCDSLQSPGSFRFLLLFHYPFILRCLWKTLYKILSCFFIVSTQTLGPFLFEVETWHVFSSSRSLACGIPGEAFCSPQQVPDRPGERLLPAAFPCYLSSLLSLHFNSPKNRLEIIGQFSKDNCSITAEIWARTYGWS